MNPTWLKELIVYLKDANVAFAVGMPLVLTIVSIVRSVTGRGPTVAQVAAEWKAVLAESVEFGEAEGARLDALAQALSPPSPPLT